MIVYTDAPPAYDYWYMIDTSQTVTSKKGKVFRVLETHDEQRLRNYQIPRYNSGLHIGLIVGEDTDQIDYLFGEQ